MTVTFLYIRDSPFGWKRYDQANDAGQKKDLLDVFIKMDVDEYDCNYAGAHVIIKRSSPNHYMFDSAGTVSEFTYETPAKIAYINRLTT